MYQSNCRNSNFKKYIFKILLCDQNLICYPQSFASKKPYLETSNYWEFNKPSSTIISVFILFFQLMSYKIANRCIILNMERNSFIYSIYFKCSSYIYQAKLISSNQPSQNYYTGRFTFLKVRLIQSLEWLFRTYL